MNRRSTAYPVGELVRVSGPFTPPPYEGKIFLIIEMVVDDKDDEERVISYSLFDHISGGLFWTQSSEIEFLNEQ